MKKILTAILIIVAIIFATIQWKVYHINNAPEEFTYEKLSQQPVGKENYITCPDGTKLRTISSGEGQTVLLLVRSDQRASCVGTWLRQSVVGH